MFYFFEVLSLADFQIPNFVNIKGPFWSGKKGRKGGRIFGNVCSLVVSGSKPSLPKFYFFFNFSISTMRQHE
jgi:hypothetical protein